MDKYANGGRDVSYASVIGAPMGARADRRSEETKLMAERIALAVSRYIRAILGDSRQQAYTKGRPGIQEQPPAPSLKPARQKERGLTERKERGSPAAKKISQERGW
jgi:hypothetical protein